MKQRCWRWRPPSSRVQLIHRAQAVVRTQQRNLTIPQAQAIKARLVGSGIEAEVDGQRIVICAAASSLPTAQQAQIEQLENQGNTVVLVTRDNTLRFWHRAIPCVRKPVRRSMACAN